MSHLEQREIDQASFKATPAPPLFDARASAHAQPVEPIRRASKLTERLHSLQHYCATRAHLAVKGRALAFVIAIGLLTGVIGGMLLVNFAAKSQPDMLSAPVQSESVSQIPPAEARKLDEFAGELETQGRTTSLTLTRGRKTKLRVPTNRPRAYRVAVIH